MPLRYRLQLASALLDGLVVVCPTMSCCCSRTPILSSNPNHRPPPCPTAAQLASAVLDVFAPEPLPQSSRLWEHPHIRIFPHVSRCAPNC